jgi:GAF domain-containing protein
MILEGDIVRVVSSQGFERYGLQDWISKLHFNITENPVWQKKIEQNAPSVTPDTEESDTWQHIEQTAWIRSHLHIPIVDEDQVIGFINLNSSQPNGFREAHIPPLIPFSNQAAIAIKNARLFAAEREQRITAEALTQITASLISTLDLKELFARHV